MIVKTNEEKFIKRDGEWLDYFRDLEETNPITYIDNEQFDNEDFVEFKLALSLSILIDSHYDVRMKISFKIILKLN